MQKIINKLFLAGVLGFMLFLIFTSIGRTGKVEASAPIGLPATLAVSTTTAVGPSSPFITIFAARSGQACSSRVIRTVGQEIILLFGDTTNGDLSSTTAAYNTGFVQAASTTVAYDSGLYGCGRLLGFASATTTIVAEELR